MRIFPMSFTTTYRGAFVGFCCALVCCAINGSVAMRGAENWALDNYFAFRGTRSSSANIVVIGIDEESLRRMKKPLAFISPELADVVQHLDQSGAQAIALDLFIPDDASDRSYFATGAEGDADRLGRAIHKARRVVLPKWTIPTKDGKGEWLTPLYQWCLKHELDPAWTDYGYVNLTTDRDTMLRREQLRAQLPNEDAQPQLALALLGLEEGYPADWFSAPELKLDGRSIPLVENDETGGEGSLLVNYVGPPGTIAFIPFHQVLDEARAASSADFWKHKTVLIGVTAYSFHDQHATPYSDRTLMLLVRAVVGWPRFEKMSGTEIQANIFATLKDRAFIVTPNWLATPLLLLIVGPLLGAFMARSSLAVGALVTLAHHWIWKLLCLTAFAQFHWRVEMMAMLLLGVMVYSVTFSLRWRMIRRMLGMVKSEAVARALESDRRHGARVGEEREITLLFADVRNFTAFSETHLPSEVVLMLNAYFAIVVPIIEAEGGTVNQYIGDGLMVMFGAPTKQSDHALRATRAAITAMQAVTSRRDYFEKLGWSDFRIGIGVFTGKVIVGTIGSPNRLEYTAIGDAVNTAARLESGSKDLKCDILVGESTYQSLSLNDRSNLLAFCREERLRVKGKQQMLNVYSLRIGPQPEPQLPTPEQEPDGPTDSVQPSVESVTFFPAQD